VQKDDAESRRRVAEVAETFHGLTMNGGFLHAFGAEPGSLADAVDAFKVLQMAEVVRLIRDGIALDPRIEHVPYPERRELVDALPEDKAEELEGLGNRYTEAVSDDLIQARIERYALPRPRLARLPRSVPEMLAEYQSAREGHAALKWKGSVSESNRLVKRAHELMKHLLTSPEGRAGIWALRDHPDREVRQWVLVDALQWEPEEATHELEALERAGSLNAKIALSEWRSGRLRFDW